MKLESQSVDVILFSETLVIFLTKKIFEIFTYTDFWHWWFICSDFLVWWFICSFRIYPSHPIVCQNMKKLEIIILKCRCLSIYKTNEEKQVYVYLLTFDNVHLNKDLIHICHAYKNKNLSDDREKISINIHQLMYMNLTYLIFFVIDI